MKRALSILLFFAVCIGIGYIAGAFLATMHEMFDPVAEDCK